MNLDELQIKISIELDDLNKQLKNLTKSIEKSIGPKATEKLMKENHRIIKRESIAINKTLNKAFDINLTKFNSNITSAMNQARQTVRSACNDIRRELNAALNINGNIRITSKTSISGSATGSTNSNSSSSMASSQYIGAMIIKATNAIISNNNTNTQQLRQDIDKSTNKIVSAIKGIKINAGTTLINGNNNTGDNQDVVEAINTSTKDIVSAIEKNSKTRPIIKIQQKQNEQQPEQKKRRVYNPNPNVSKNDNKADSGIFSTKPFDDLIESVNELNFIVIKTIEQYENAVEALKNATKVANIFKRGQQAQQQAINTKMLGTGSYNNKIVKSSNPIGKNRNKEYFKGEVINPGIIPTQVSKQLQNIIEVSYRVLDLEKNALKNTANFDIFGSGKLDTSQVDAMTQAFKDTHNIRKQSRIPRLNEPAEDYDASEFMVNELHRQVASLMDMAQELNEAFHQTPMGIDEAVQQANFLEEALNAVLEGSKDLTSLSPQIAKGFEFARDILNQMTPGIRALANEIRNFTKPQAPAGLPALEWQDINGSRPEFPDSAEKIEFEWNEVNPSEKPQIPESAIIDVEWKDVDNVEEDVTKVNKTLTETKKLISDLSKITPDLNAENGMDDYHRKQMSTILDANTKEVGAFTSKTDLSKLKDMMAQLQKMSEELESDFTELFHNVDAQYLEESLLSVRDVIKSFMPRLKEVVETLNGLDAERIKLNIDTADAQRQIEALKASYEMLIEQCKAAYKANNANILRDIIPQIGGPVDSENKRQYPAKPNLKRGDSDKPSKPGKPPKPTIMGFGFGAYKNEINALIEYAKKAGIRIKEALFNSNSQNLGFAPYQNELHELGELAKRIGSVIKEKLSNAFSSIKGFNLGNFNFNQAFDSHVAVHQVGEIKAKLGEIKAKYKETVSEINSIASKLTAPFKKLGSIAYKGISSGLNKAKTALDKFANGCKSSWAKITGIFRKGSNDCGKAMSPLRSSLSSLASMFGLYQLGSIFIDGTKQAIKYEASLMTIQRTLGGASKALIDFANNNAQAFGISKSQVMEFGNIFSVIVSNFEKDGTKVAGTTQKLLESAGIIAGATGYDVNQVLENLRSGILGSSEAVDQLGLNLKVASLEASESFRQIANGAKSWNDLTEAQKQAIIAQEIINQTTAKYGGIVKNTSSMHNAFIAQLNNTKLALGKLGKALYTAILPALTTIMAVLEKVFTYAAQAVTSLLEVFGITVDFAANVQPPDDSLGDSIGDSVGDSFDDAKDSVEDAEEAVEKFKGSLAGFDEINILSDNTPKTEDPEVPDDGGIGDIGDIGEIGTPEFSEGEGMFDKLGEKFKAFIDEILEPFKKAWELYGNDLKEEWKDLIDSFKHFCDSLATFLKSVWDNGGKEFVQHMAEIALAVAIAAMEIGGEILDSLARLWEHLDPSKNMNTKGFLDALNEVSQKLRDFILGLGDHFESLMAHGGQDVLNALGDCFMNLGEAAARGLGVVIDALDGLMDHLDPAINENTRNMLKALADMFHAVGQTALDFVSLLESCLVNGGQDMINAFGDMMMNLGQATFEVITTMMQSFSKLFKYLDPATNEITKNMMKAWEEAFLAIGQAALGFSELFKSVMENGGQDVLNKLGDAFNSLLTLVGTVVEEIAKSLDALFEHLDPKTNEFTQGMLKAWQDAFDGISNMFLNIGDVIASAMANGGQDVVNAIGDLGMQILETFGNIVEEVADCIGELFKHLDPAENDVAKGALEAFKYFIDSIRNFIEMLGDALGTFMDNGGQEFVNNLGDIISLIGDLAFTIGGDIINAITTFMDSWAGQMLIESCARALEVISEVLEGLLRILEPLSPIISGVVTAIGGFIVASKVVGFIQGIATVFQTIAGSGGVLALAKAGFTALWGVIAANPVAATVAAIVGIGTVLVALYNKCEWFRDAVNKVFARIKEPVEKLMETFSDLLENVTDIFGNIIDVIVGIFEGDGYKVGEAVRNMVLNIIEVFKGLFEFKQNLAEIGWNLILGLIEGIWECIKNIPQLLAGIGEFVVDFFKGLFGIHSPSTVFKELGINLIEGLIEGILSMISSIGEAFTNLKESLVGWVKDIVDGAVETWSNLKESITTNLGELYNNVSDKWQEIKENVSDKCKDIYENTKEKWTNIKDKTIELASDLKDKAEEKYTQLKDKLTDTVEKWRQNNEDKWTKIKDKTSDIVSKIKEHEEDKYNKLKDKLTDIMEKWRSNNEEKWNKIKDKTTDLVTNLKDTVEDKYTKFKEKLTDTMEDWRKNSEDKWSKIKSKTSELVNNLKTDTEDKFNTMKESLVNKMETLRSTSESKWNDIKKKASESINNLKKDVEDKYTSMKNTLTDRLETFRKTSVDKWEDIKKKAGESISNLKSDVESKYETLKNNLTNKLETWRSTSESKWNDIKEKGVGAIENIRSAGEEKFESLKSAITSRMETIRAESVAKWEEVKNKATSAISTMKSEVENKYNELKTNIGKKLEEVKSEANSKWESIKTTAGTKAKEVVTEATSKFGEIKSSFTKKMDEVKNALTPKWTELKNSVKTNASGLGDKVTEGLSGLKNKFTKPFEDAKKAIGDVISGIGKTLSNANWSLPKLKLPHLKISGSFSLNPPSVPKFSVEWYKRGGIIDGITPLGFTGGTIHMGGEAGKEMVVPLENTSFTSKIAQAMGQAVDNAMARNMNNMYGSSANNSNDSKDIVLKVNERELARASINSINKLQRESGRTLLDI